jgi:hypothetical protein
VAALALCAPPIRAATTHFVDDDACPGPSTGTNIDPYCSIQTAINAAVDTDTISVEPGTYNEIIDLLGKAITLQSTGGAAVTTMDATLAPDPGDGKPVVRCDSGEGPDTIIQGFTITGGTGDTSHFGSSSTTGGGMIILDSSPTIMNCEFVNNNVRFGGGVYSGSNSGTMITDCVFDSNSATHLGGGIVIRNGTIRKCLFIDNVTSGVGSSHGGGGIWWGTGSGSIEQCMFIRNNGGYAGGAILTWSNLQITNSLFIANDASAYGGGIAAFQNVVSTTNCVFEQNTANEGGGIAKVASIANVEVANSIFRGNLDTAIYSFPDLTKFSIVNSNIEGGATGTNIIDLDPMFATNPSPGPDGMWDGVDDDFGDLHLQPGSPCIDTAANAAPNLPATDLDDNTRVQNCVVDMGAYEFTQPGPITDADTDCDGDVDGVDFAQFAQCFNKSGNPPRTLGCSTWAAGQLDFDDDTDVDGLDFAKFAQCFNKAGNPPRTLGCPQN